MGRTVGQYWIAHSECRSTSRCWIQLRHTDTQTMRMSANQQRGYSGWATQDEEYGTSVGRGPKSRAEESADLCCSAGHADPSHDPGK